MDAFDVLGVEPSFDLDAKLLEQRYRDLLRALHPDRYVQAPRAERRASLLRAVDVNEAYRALRDELKRAELLYQRYGGAAEAGGASADPALLMEVMELREQLADPSARADSRERGRLAQAVRAKRAEASEALRRAFQALAAGDRGALPGAARALERLRYYRRFLEEVAVLEEALD